MRALVLALCSLVAGCALPGAPNDEEGPARTARGRQSTCTITNEVTVGHPRVWFSPFEPVEDQVVCALQSAQREVLVAHYNIRSERVIDTLVGLRARGVDVRIAVDAKNAVNEWNEGDDRLERAGVTIVRFQPTDARAIMHLKVAVVDASLALTGSFNWNETAANANDENMIAFRDPELVTRYRDQVRELLGEQPRAIAPSRATTWASLHFAPEEQVDRVIVRAIDAAKTSVDVAMFTFTMRSISDALVRAQTRGVKVRLVVEAKQQDLSDAEDRVAASGALVVRAANRIGPHSAMHQKYAVVDATRVITGATNWTFSGTRSNEEDLLVLDVPELARDYARNFADLLHVYADLEEGPATSASPVLFHGVHDSTGWGDTVVVVGSDPALGAWDPSKGVPMGGEMFPTWTTRAQVPAGAHVEWKLVTLRANGEAVWEPGPNRVLDAPANGRAVVIGGTFGDTTSTWTPSGR